MRSAVKAGRRFAVAGVTGSLVALSVSGATTATARPVDITPPQFTVGLVTVNGSGCPAGTASVAAAPDKTAFTVTYSNYLAQVGVGAKPTDFRKNCQIMVRVNAPQGFTYGIAQTDYRGYASLAGGASAREQASYYFQGQSPTANVVHPFYGPMDDNWQATDATAVRSIVYAPCGATRDLAINTQLNVSAGTSNPAKTTSFMTMDSTDGSLSTVYHLGWRKCT
ncbi:DUF4360 domain-containing protein [Streptomyces sp. NPDC059680]|uniref:DUF4360 domain-containing protein n=1 Tax=Streptomyces sp. NPDC059680 TaxID=3346904 RepID=UPI00369AE105